MGFGTTTQQVGLMAVFILLGLFAAKKGWLGQAAILGLTNVLVYFVTPAVIVLSFHRPFSAGQWHNMWVAGLVTAAAYLAMIGLVWLLYGKVRDPALRRDLRFSGIYSNAGFMGIPLVQALLGADGVFFAALFLVGFNLFAWTQGWSMWVGARGADRPTDSGADRPDSGADRPADSGGPLKPLKPLLTNPVIPAVVIGVVLFVTSAPLPRIVTDGLGYLSGINAPLSMFVIGANLLGVRWKSLVADRWLWLATAVRTLLIPAIAILALWHIPLPEHARLALLIPLSCPVATYLVMFGVLHRTDTGFATRLVCLSTALSVLTLPTVTTVATALW